MQALPPAFTGWCCPSARHGVGDAAARGRGSCHTHLSTPTHISEPMDIRCTQNSGYKMRRVFSASPRVGGCDRRTEQDSRRGSAIAVDADPVSHRGQTHPELSGTSGRAGSCAPVSECVVHRRPDTRTTRSQHQLLTTRTPQRKMRMTSMDSGICRLPAASCMAHVCGKGNCT